MEIDDFFHRQSRISSKNVIRLKELAASAARDVAARAAVMIEVAQVAPGKRRRLRRIRSSHPELWQRMQTVGLLWPAASDEWPEYLPVAGAEPSRENEEEP